MSRPPAGDRQDHVGHAVRGDPLGEVPDRGVEVGPGEDLALLLHGAHRRQPRGTGEGAY